MKKRLSLLLSVVFLFSLFSLPSCMKESSENLAYTITGETCTITGIGENRSRKIVIPSEIEGKRVTAIADEAFKNNDWLYSVSIPSSVAYVGEYAFYDCDFLRYATIDMPSGSRIMPYAFAKCNRLKEAYLTNFACGIGEFIFDGTPQYNTIFLDENQAAIYLKETYADRLIRPESTKIFIDPVDKGFSSFQAFQNFFQKEFKNSSKKLVVLPCISQMDAIVIKNGTYNQQTNIMDFVSYANRVVVSSEFSNDYEGAITGEVGCISVQSKSTLLDSNAEIDLKNLTFLQTAQDEHSERVRTYEVYSNGVKLTTCKIGVWKDDSPIEERFDRAKQIVQENLVIL